MKPVTMYEADDGTVWATPDEAARRDLVKEKCDMVLRWLGMGERPDTSDFDNGRGYVQQPAGTRVKLWGELKALGWNRDSDGPLGRLAYRAQCIDEHDREWGQPFFARNPSEGEQREVSVG